MAKFTADKIRGLFENSQINAPPFITRGADLVTNENLMFHNLPYLTLFYSTQKIGGKLDQDDFNDIVSDYFVVIFPAKSMDTKGILAS